MAYLSIKELSNLYNKPESTFRKALQRNKLQGHKSPTGCWLIEEKDAAEYFNAPTSPKWISCQNLSAFFCIPIEKLFHLRDQCDFETKNFKGKIFVRTNKIYPTLVATGFIRHCEGDTHYQKTRCFNSSFRVQNKKGLHLRPSVCICTIAKKYYPNTRIELIYKDIAWEFCPSGALNDLLLLKVPNRGVIKVKTWGLFKKKLAKDLVLASENRFYF